MEGGREGTRDGVTEERRNTEKYTREREREGC